MVSSYEGEITTLKDLAIYFDKRIDFFRYDEGPGAMISQLYGKITRENIIKYNSYCEHLINLINKSLELKLVTKKELADVVYGEGSHTSKVTVGMLKNREYYEPFTFMSNRIFNNYQIAEKHIKNKYNELVEEMSKFVIKEYR